MALPQTIEMLPLEVGCGALYLLEGRNSSEAKALH